MLGQQRKSPSNERQTEFVHKMNESGRIVYKKFELLLGLARKVLWFSKGARVKHNTSGKHEIARRPNFETSRRNLRRKHFESETGKVLFPH